MGKERFPYDATDKITGGLIVQTTKVAATRGYCVFKSKVRFWEIGDFEDGSKLPKLRTAGSMNTAKQSTTSKEERKP